MELIDDVKVTLKIVARDIALLIGRQEGHPACQKWGMVEVGTA